MMRFIDCSVKSEQFEMMKRALVKEAFSKPKSVIPVQPETFNMRSVLQILETSTGWLSLNLDSHVYSLRGFANVAVT